MIPRAKDIVILRSSRVWVFWRCSSLHARWSYRQAQFTDYSLYIALSIPRDQWVLLGLHQRQNWCKSFAYVEKKPPQVAWLGTDDYGTTIALSFKSIHFCGAVTIFSAFAADYKQASEFLTSSENKWVEMYEVYWKPRKRYFSWCSMRLIKWTDSTTLAEKLTL
jgi:hypothetical protein